MVNDREKIETLDTVDTDIIDPDETIAATPQVVNPSTGQLPRPSSYAVTPETPGRYHVGAGESGEGEIGRGGIGRILAVYDEHLQREVAAKEIQPEMMLSGGYGDTEEHTAAKVARFLREARITGQLIHPNIVPVYEVGMREDGALYYTMRLVRGKTFKQALRECDNLDERLKLLPHFADLCNAIAFAHNREVIHRDIKPDNVMLGEFGETLVLDWGLAKVLSEPEEEPLGPEVQRMSPEISASASSSLTVDGSFMGTPSYASPEQVTGRLNDIDEGTDVWSLGVMLYEILTGSPPFAGKTAQEVLIKVLTDEVVPPTEVDGAIPSDLSSVCVKALERMRDERYSSARMLAEEIESFRSGGRVQAHEYSAWEHFKRFAAQKKGLLGAAVAIVVVVIAALIFVGASYTSERTARKEAQLATANEQEAREKERLEKLRAAYHFAQGAAEKANLLSSQKRSLAARIYASAALARNPSNPNSPLFEPSFEERHPHSKTLFLESSAQVIKTRAASMISHTSNLSGDTALNWCEISPDGRLVAEATRDGRVRIKNLDAKEVVRTLKKHLGDVTMARFSPTGSRLISVGKDGLALLWDPASGTLLKELGSAGEGLLCAAWSPDGKTLATAGVAGTVFIWDASSGQPITQLAGHTAPILGLDFSPDGGRIVSGSRDRTVRIWDIAKGGTLRAMEGHSAVVSKVSFSPDGKSVASSSYDKTVRVWDASTGEPRFKELKHNDEAMSVDYSPDGTLIATASWDRSLRLWDASNGALIVRLEVHDDAVLNASFSADGKRIATTPNSGSSALWSVGEAAPIMSAGDQGFIWSAYYSPNGKTIATSTQDGAIRIWDSSTGRLLRTMIGHEDLVQKISFSPDGSRLASGGYDRKVRIWDPTTGELVTTLEGHSDAVRSVAYSPDGTMVVSAGKDGVYRLWNVETGEVVAQIDEEEGQARGTAFSPDGKLLAMGGDASRLVVADSRSGAEIRRMDIGKGKITCVAFSRDSSKVAASTWDGDIHIWEASSGTPIITLSRGNQAVYTIEFSPDDRQLVSAEDNGTVAVWNLKTGKPVLLFGMDQAVFAVDFSPDGKFLVLANFDTGYVYPLDLSILGADPVKLQKNGEKAAGRELVGFRLTSPEAEGK